MNRRDAFKLCLIMGVSLGSGTSSLAEDTRPPGKHFKNIFSSYDKDNDGTISEGEFKEFQASPKAQEVRGMKPFSLDTVPFAELDLNKDGGVSSDEFRKGLHLSRRPSSLRDKLANRGFISHKPFAAVDKNHDGCIDEAEYADAYAAQPLPPNPDKPLPPKP